MPYYKWAVVIVNFRMFEPIRYIRCGRAVKNTSYSIMVYWSFRNNVNRWNLHVDSELVNISGDDVRL